MLASTIDNLSVLRRFVAKTKKTERTFEGTPCWEWIGAHNSKGYPTITVSGATKYAHRIAYELWFAPPGPHVHHKCLNSSCLNPLHPESTTAEHNRALQALGVGVVPTDLDDDTPF